MDQITQPSQPAALTFADAIALLQQDQTLPPRRQGEMVSALRTTARLFGLEPAALPADFPTLRARFRTIAPATGGFSRRRLDNLRSLLLLALRTARAGVVSPTRSRPLCPAWQALHSRLPDTAHRLGLSRFIGSCNAQGLAPETVDAATFAAFAEALETDSLVKKPAVVHRTTCQLWNSAGRVVPGWPALIAPVPACRRRRSPLAWTDFPASFQADVDDFLERQGNPDPFADDYAKPVRPSTTKLRRVQILQIATALVGAGQPVAAVTGLAALVLLPQATAALRFILERQGGQRTTYLYQQALLLKMLAEHWVEVDTPQLEALRQLCRKLQIRQSGMTEKNRQRLRQFDNPKNVSALVNLPRQTFARLARQHDGGRTAALQAMDALAMELLTVAPLRADNLTGLRLDQHIVETRAGSTRTVHLAIAAGETKNEAPYELQLPPETVELLAIYRARYHPRLSQGHSPSPWLFPNAMGGRRSTIAFARSVCDFVLQGTGITMNLHLFRHVAVKLHLAAHPHDFETARRILGHKSAATTMRFYAEMKNDPAFRRYDEVIRALREQPTGAARRKAPARRTASAKAGRS